MPQKPAHIVGTTGANFTFTIDSAKIANALLRVTGQPTVSLAISGSEREVTVPSLPAGDSKVRLDLVWGPGDSDTTVDVGEVTTGNAQAADPPAVITLNTTPFFVKLFGTGA
jgi:hypothetical protein